MKPAPLSRRVFLARAAATGAGLVIGFKFPERRGRAAALTRSLLQEQPAPAKPKVAPDAYLRIAPDDTVTVLLKHSEMGQGISTSIPMAVAEELECDWQKVRFEHAPAAPAYFHTVYGIQMTGGSTSTWESFEQMRTVGAMARQMLVETAAERWNVPASECRAEGGVVIHGDRRARYGELAADAMKRAPPAEVKLKEQKQWKLLGRATHRLDGPAKVAGKAEFGIDVRRPGMLFALVARSPWLGGTVKSFDASAAKAVPGVVDVIQIPSGIGVVAQHTWAARLGRDALKIEWEPGPIAGFSSDTQRADYRKLAAAPGTVAKKSGDADAAMAKAARTIEAEYEVPYLSHSMMEPLNCTAEVRADGCEVWTGTQFQTGDHAAAAAICSLKPEQVQLHTTLLGGGFGRRASLTAQFVTEAVLLAKATGKPVQAIWTREDDVRGGWYRPMWLARLRAGLDASGRIAGWTHTIVGQSILEGTPFSMMIKDGVDETSVEGAADSHYLDAIADHKVELHTTKLPIPVTWWRSVGHTHTAFEVESFLDELAHAAGKEPLEFRRALLKEGSRPRRVLDAAAELFGWGKSLPKGHGAGLAVHTSFGSCVANAAEVSVENGKIRVHRVACAIDCGPVVNPDGVVAQLEGGVVFALSAVLHGKLTFRDGRVEQSNFHDYPLARMVETPRIDVNVLASDGPMGGVGEPGVPAVAPAVANALFRANGKRLRRLPLELA